MNVTYARRKAQRLCPWCTVPVEEPGRTYCPACREMLNELEQERKRRLRVAQRHPATPRARSTRGRLSQIIPPMSQGPYVATFPAAPCRDSDFSTAVANRAGLWPRESAPSNPVVVGH